MENLQRCQPWRMPGLVSLVSDHVVRAGARRGASLLLILCDPVMLLVAGTALRSLARLPARRLVAEPDAPVPTVRLSDAQRIFLHKLSRRTWRFFEDFVTEEENWLPPDNYQEKPDR